MNDGWIQTYTGRRFYPLAPRAEDVCIEDIAHALSLKCRFGGHCRPFYSVAEHSVLVMRHVPENAELAALMHDAPEAYSPYGDVPRPMKTPHVREVEERIEEAIYRRYPALTLSFGDAAEIRRIDNAILADERRHLLAPMAESAEEWGAPEPPLGIDRFPCWPPFYAEKVFLNEFRRLTT